MDLHEMIPYPPMIKLAFSLEALKMYYVMRASAPSLHRESV